MVKLGCAGAPHLTYCTNVHAGDAWADVRRNVATHVVSVKRRVRPDGLFGVGLRLSARAAGELAAPAALDDLRGLLEAEGLYVFTVNGFPYGEFHGAPVKEKVYAPDWLEGERVRYTTELAEILAALLPEGVDGSVSTVPAAFAPRIPGDVEADAAAENLLRQAALLVRLFDRTGRRVALALEPEPFCRLATVEQTVSFFERHLFSPRARLRFAEWAGLAGGAAEEALRAHLGVCFDACHMAVEFEDVSSALSAFGRAGVAVPKMQLSAGLEVRPEGRSSEELSRALEPFAEGVYLHQVTERTPSGDLVRYLDLPEALEAVRARRSFGERWRIHFHVPVYREDLGLFASTQSYLAELLGLLHGRPVAPHLEVETYTWDVLPPEHRADPIDVAVARELAWVRAHLEAT